MMNRKIGLICFFLVLPMVCPGLEPEQILVIANRNAAKSVGLAKYYMKQRDIPKTNLLLLWVTDKETCSREDYQDKMVPMVRKYLAKKDKDNHIRCLVTMYGIPLKITAPEMTRKEKDEYEKLKQRRKVLYDRKKAKPEDSLEDEKTLTEELDVIQKRIAVLSKSDQRAALDSELALIKIEDYPLSGWLPNPYFLGFQNQKLDRLKEKVLMVSRLDGPTPETVRRIIDDSVAVEKTGLSGTAYFDARWPKPDKEKKVKGYGFYDKSIHLAAGQIRRESQMSVVIDDQAGLFQPGQCPDAALYCGWYSLGRYVDAFSWVKGSVGYHIASSECATLKNTNSRVWCKRMLEKGVSATVGPTSEPYVQAFPVPEIFFGLLLEGTGTLVECYMSAVPFLSWQMVLVGDPLYTPFKNRG